MRRANRNGPTEHLHWQRLGAAADEARSRLGKFLEAVDETGADGRLSREGKAEERKKAAEKALAAFDGSKTLERARESVASVMASWEAKITKLVQPAKDHGEAVTHAQIRDRLSSMKDTKERMSFLERHGADPTLANAVLSAPSFLSGLNEVELAFVRSKVEARALPPEVIEAKAALAKALREVEVGWERAKAKIASGGGLEKSSNGSVSAAA